MKVYLDPNTFECHASAQDGTFLEYDTPFFDGKCARFIEGHRCIPPGHSWEREDGEVFSGEMISVTKDDSLLEAAQAQYEEDLAEAASAYQKGVDSV
jgi:hypothetical protein